MIKRLAIIGASLVFLGGAYIGATGAFFSDSQTSTGNTFTAGAITLKVDDTQHYNNAICTNTGTVGAPVYTWQLAAGQTVQPDQYPVIGSSCDGTWTPTNLGLTNHLFFNFSDIKPQDQGEDTISLDNSGNPAWLCADVNLTDNATSTGEIAFDGNLANNIEVFAWRDNATTSNATAGDNIYEPAQGETALFGPETITALMGGNASSTSTTTIPLIDSSHGGGSPMAASSTSYIGWAWCAGTMTVNPITGVITCDGTSMGNSSQNNTLMANITLQANQSRNQPNFECTGAPVTGPTTGNLTVIKHVVHLASADAAITAGDFDIHVKNASTSVDVAGSPHAGAESPGFTFTGLPAPATYTVTENGPITITGEHVVATYTGNCSGVDTVNVTASTTSTCTLTNTYVANPL